MDIAELLATSPGDLARKQEIALSEFIQARLDKISHHLKNREYERVLDMLSSSPAGDDMGCDNRFIDFSDLGLTRSYSVDGDDIGDAVDRLIDLKAQAEASK